MCVSTYTKFTLGVQQLEPSEFRKGNGTKSISRYLRKVLLTTFGMGEVVAIAVYYVSQSILL